MARLKNEVKVFIVERLACFEAPEDIIEAVKESFGLTVTKQALQAYNPATVNGQTLSAALRKVFDDTRKRYLEDTSDIPIAQKAYRLRRLQKLADKAESRGNAVLAASLYEQAAREAGDAFTNRRELTGAGGKDLVPPPLSEAERTARIASLLGKAQQRQQADATD